MPPTKEFVSIAEASRRIGISEPTVRKAIASKEIRTVSIPGLKRPRIPLSEVLRILNEVQS